MYDYDRRSSLSHRERVAISDSRFGPNLQRDVEHQYGKIKEIHYEDSRCEDGNGNLTSDPYFTVITQQGRLTVILRRDFKHIKEMHLEN